MDVVIPWTTWLLVPFLIWIVISDILFRRIANRLILLMLLIWSVVTLAHLVIAAGEGELAEALSRLGHAVVGAVVVLVVGFLLFQMGQVGGGDVKLIVVLCLWLGQGEQWVFVIMTSLIGGLMVLGLPLLYRTEVGLARVWQSVGRTLALNWPTPLVLTEHRPQGLPYGLAIVAGAFYTLFVHIYY